VRQATDVRQRAGMPPRCCSLFRDPRPNAKISVRDGREGFHHARLPSESALLAGRFTSNELAFHSESLQVWFNETNTGWTDDRAHFHEASDEIFVALAGTVVVEVNGERVRVEAGEFCCFPAGLSHQIVSTEPPLRTLMIRAPSVEDKAYPETQSAYRTPPTPKPLAGPVFGNDP
jgi:mannose-6-phosphate isomerase-like protein (cupin superfamily)